MRPEDVQDIDYIRRGMDELKVRFGDMQLMGNDTTILPQTWDWTFGQTPEFTYKVERSFPWGVVVCCLQDSLPALTNILAVRGASLETWHTLALFHGVFRRC